LAIERLLYSRRNESTCSGVHAALELGHEDDLERLLRHGHEVLLPHEGRRLGQRLAGELHDAVAGRTVRGGERERCGDHGLLLGGRR
jgi:hypothetical protein